MLRKAATGVLVVLTAAACGSSKTGGSNAGSAPGVTKTQITIGTHLPLTGSASFVGQGFQVGENLAVDEINKAGGINGRQLKVDYIDDKGTPDGAVAAVRRMVERDGVFTVFGGGTSTSTVSVLPYFAQNGIPYYVSLASDPKVLQGNPKNIFLGATVPQTDLVKTYIKFLTDNLHAKTVALMLCDGGVCTSGGPLLKSGLQAAGVTVTTTANYSSGDTDFTGQIHQVAGSHPDVVFVYGLATDGERIIPQLRRAGITVPIVGDTSQADPSVLKVAGASSDGFYSFFLGGHQLLDDNTGAMANWLTSLHANILSLPPQTPNLYSLMAYADTYVLAQGILKEGKNPTRNGLIQSLNTNINGFLAGEGGAWPKAEPIGLPRTFTPTNHQGTNAVAPIKAVNGKFQTVS